MKNSNIATKGLNVIALAFMFLFLSFMGNGEFQKALALDPDPCCCKGVGSCQEDGEFCKAMKESQAARQTAEIIAGEEAREQGRQNAIRNPTKDAYGKVGSKYCLDIYSNILDKLAGLLSNPFDFIMNAIKSILAQALNAVCNYAVAAINNALNSICIPMPSISLPQFGIGGPNYKYCDGISPGMFIQAYRKPLPGELTKAIQGLPTGRDVLRRNVPMMRDIRR